MQLLAGSISAATITLAPAQNNLSGLTSALRNVTGIYAEFDGSTVSIYNAACIDGATCATQSDALSLCDGTCNGRNNLLMPKTMSEVGCALTVLAMACNFAGASSLNTLPAGSVAQFNPESLNFFMSKVFPSNSVEGQFEKNGNVNWTKTVLAVSANTGLQLSFNPNGISSRPDPTSADAVLNSALCSDQLPVIVQVADQYGAPHFVLVTGNNGQGTTPSDGSEYRIADPGYGKQSLKDSPYNNGFTTVGTVSDPPDRSMLTVSVLDDANVEIIDPVGRITGFDPGTSSILKQIPLSTYSQEQIGDDSGAGHNEGITRSVYVTRPLQGTYQVVAAGLRPGLSWVSITGVSQGGITNVDTDLPIITSSGSASTFSVQYASVPGGSPAVQPLATFAGVLADIASALQQNWIDNQGIANSLSQKIQAASQSNGFSRLNQLNAFINEVNAQTGKHIGSPTAQVLLQDANSLINQIP
jgi:hypothetical protein